MGTRIDSVRDRARFTARPPGIVIDSVTRLERYPNVRIASNGSWLESEQGSEDD